MTDQKIIDIAKKHMEYSVMYGFVGEPTVDAVLAFARDLLATADRQLKAWPKHGVWEGYTFNPYAPVVRDED